MITTGGSGNWMDLKLDQTLDLGLRMDLRHVYEITQLRCIGVRGRGAGRRAGGGGAGGDGTTCGRRRPAASSHGRMRPPTAAGGRPRPPAGACGRPRPAAAAHGGARVEIKWADPGNEQKPLFFQHFMRMLTTASSVTHAESGIRDGVPTGAANVQSVRTGYAPSLQLCSMQCCITREVSLGEFGKDWPVSQGC